MAKNNHNEPQVTIESLRLAAKEMHAKGASTEQRKNLLAMLTQKTQYLTKQDIAKWRRAWQQAISIDNPNRSALYDIYTDALIDLHLTGCISQRTGKTLLKSFVIRKADGKEDEDAKKNEVSDNEK